jgi:hypothetical protein
MLQAEIEVPSIEALMACPLSKFIHFAANDCGYTGSRYELIANWVHPLFLKAKTEASKEQPKLEASYVWTIQIGILEGCYQGD